VRRVAQRMRAGVRPFGYTVAAPCREPRKTELEPATRVVPFGANSRFASLRRLGASAPLCAALTRSGLGRRAGDGFSRGAARRLAALDSRAPFCCTWPRLPRSVILWSVLLHAAAARRARRAAMGCRRALRDRLYVCSGRGRPISTASTNAYLNPRCFAVRVQFQGQRHQPVAGGWRQLTCVPSLPPLMIALGARMDGAALAPTAPTARAPHDGILGARPSSSRRSFIPAQHRHLQAASPGRAVHECRRWSARKPSSASVSNPIRCGRRGARQSLPVPALVPAVYSESATCCS